MKYILTRKIIAKDVLLPGSIIELSPEQAATPMYRNRVTPYEATLEVEREAEPSGEKSVQQDAEPALETKPQQKPKPRGRGRNQA